MLLTILILNLAAVSGVVWLHIRQTLFERKIITHINSAAGIVGEELTTIKAALLKSIAAGAIVALLAAMLKGDKPDDTL